jgi:hypothetical protein
MGEARLKHYAGNCKLDPPISREDIQAEAFHHHGGAVVLVMTPYVARLVHEVMGMVAVTDNHPIRMATDSVWKAMESHVELNEFMLVGSLTATVGVIPSEDSCLYKDYYDED